MDSQPMLSDTPPGWHEAGAPRVLRPRDRRRPATAPAAGGELALERYRLLERLGRGGFGEVWRARDERLHRDVALKRIWLGPDGDSERAAREALAAARLSHPAIVALYEARAQDDAFYLISELIDGDTLAALIAAGSLGDREVIEIGIALVGALAHAHARGVIHRDIKPQNVLIPHRAHSVAEAAKLTDFGGATLAGEDALTRTGDVLGTLAYMAPEQSDGREAGEASDLYALALVLYEAFSGINPVRGPTPAATARRIGRRLEPLARRRRELPRALTHAIDTALEPQPASRGTLTALGSQLQEELERDQRRTNRAGAAVASTPRTLRRARLARARGIAAATAHGAGLAAGSATGAGTEPHAGAHTRVAPRPAPAPAAVRPQLAAFPVQALGGAPPAQAVDAAFPATAAGAADAAHAEPAQRGWLALPRPLWIAAAGALVCWLCVSGRSGLALLVATALAPLALLPIGRSRAGTSPLWTAAALAPALGVAALAGAYPALAGQASRWRERAALGALGYWWLTLAEPLLGRRLWLGPPAHTPAHGSWEGSLTDTAAHVIAPACTVAVVLGAALWALAALVLPLAVRGRSAPADVLAAACWAAALVIAAPAFDAGLAGSGAHASPRGALLGALLGALIAVAARAVRGPV